MGYEFWYRTQGRIAARCRQCYCLSHSQITIYSSLSSLRRTRALGLIGNHAFVTASICRYICKGVHHREITGFASSRLGFKDDPDRFSSRYLSCCYPHFNSGLMPWLFCVAKGWAYTCTRCGLGWIRPCKTGDANIFCASLDPRQEDTWPAQRQK